MNDGCSVDVSAYHRHRTGPHTWDCNVSVSHCLIVLIGEHRGREAAILLAVFMTNSSMPMTSLWSVVPKTGGLFRTPPDALVLLTRYFYMHSMSRDIMNVAKKVSPLLTKNYFVMRSASTCHVYQVVC